MNDYKKLFNDFFKSKDGNNKRAEKQSNNKQFKGNIQEQFLNVFTKFSIEHSNWEIWNDFVTMFACSISNSVDKLHYEKREKMYMSIIHKYNKKDQIIFPELAAKVVLALEENSNQDFLGEIFMKLKLNNSSSGQFFTPYNICEMMAKMIIGDIKNIVKKDGYVSINDPCCGAGATLIAGINEAKNQLEKENINYQNHVLVVAQDIDFNVAMMCYIQISLLGIAGYVKVGNALTNPIAKDDDSSNYWFTPMYFSEIWTIRRILEKI